MLDGPSIGRLGRKRLGAVPRVGAFWPLLGIVALRRGFGPCAISTASITVVGKWYPGRPGPPMAVYSVLMGILLAAAFKGAPTRTP